MSKVFKQFEKYMLQPKSIAKIFGNHAPGARILPNNLQRENAKYELRLDAGEVKHGLKHLCLQVNSEAKSPVLKEFKGKHTTHANLATTSIKVDTPIEKQKEELCRALKDLQTQYKSKIG